MLYLLSFIANYIDEDDADVFTVRVCLLSTCTLFVAVLVLLHKRHKLRSVGSSVVRFSMQAVNLMLYLVIDSRFLENFFDVREGGIPSYLGVVLICTTACLLIPCWLLIVSNSCYLLGYLLIHATNDLNPRSELIEICLVEIIFLFIALKNPLKSQSHDFSVLDQPVETEEDAPYTSSVLEEISSKLKSAISGLKRYKRSSNSTVQPILGVTKTLLEIKDQLKRTASVYSFVPKDTSKSEHYADITTHTIAAAERPPIQRPISQARLDLFLNYEFEDLIAALAQLGKNWNIDMFFISRLSSDKPLQVCGKYFLTKYRFHEIFQISDSAFSNFLETIESKYKANPYHNSCHAADVLSSTVFLINQSDLRNATSDIELMSLVIAALAHDVGHPGFTNRYLVNTRDSLAIEYNDLSVLEMMHASTVFNIMRAPFHNMFENLSGPDWLTARRVILESILATDMTKHFDLITRFKELHTAPAKLGSIDQRMDYFRLVMKCADIGHAAKTTALHEQWTMLICEEFFRQGDLEKAAGLPVSMFCDRETTNIAKSQSGFLKNLVLPLFEALNTPLVSTRIQEACIEQIHYNLAAWNVKSKTRRRTFKPKPEEEKDEFQKLKFKFRSSRRTRTDVSTRGAILE